METRTSWKVIRVGVWVAGMTVALLASLVQSRVRPDTRG